MNREPRTAAELIRLEAAALVAAADRIDEVAFARAVELICATEGRVVLSGAGTSGIIARKLAATLTSTGTSALFLHPSDALHGALGIVSSEDTAVMISNSGETDELLALVPYLEHRKVPIVAIVGNDASTLAARAEVTLDARVDREACALNLAPTASSTLAMAVGDALAVRVMEAKKLTPEQFAFNHPSGRLGRRLTLTVGSLLGPSPRPMVAPSTPWLEVLAAVTAGSAGAVTVEADGRLVGLITEGDLRRTMLAHGSDDLEALTAVRFMTADPVAVAPDMLAYDALQQMESRPSQISVVPVVDSTGQCLGILRLHDLVRSGI